jgi:hypothetical protein
MKLHSANMGMLVAGAVCVGPVLGQEEAMVEGIQVDTTRYEHSLKKSLFNVGAGEQERVEGAYRRASGDRGVFLTDTITGATLGVLSAPAVAKGAPVRADDLQHLPRPLTDDPEQHTARVRDYLLAAGVPQAQVSGTHVTTTMAGGGPVDQGMQPGQSRLLWYTTHLERSLGGIEVEGSYAFAALDSEGKAITEGVYWPAIPASVVRQARALKQRLATAEGAQSFRTQALLARPDVDDAPGEVKIVHTGPSYHGNFEAKAVYSVIVRNPGGGKARIVRFDDTGATAQLADEVKPVGKSSTGDSPKVR